MLLRAMTRMNSHTANGAVTNSTTLNPVLDLFYLSGASRGLSEADIIGKFSLAYNTDKELTMRLLFWAGDIREGSGQRRFFRICLNWLWNTYPETVLANIENVPFFNRFDSLFTIKHPKVYEYLYAKLKAKDGLAGKWMPRKKQYNNFGDAFRRHFKMSLKYYRQLIVEATNVVENKMCVREWGAINYSHVPSRAFKNYRKAFKKRDEARFDAFISKVNKGEAKINAKAIFPHDIVKEYMNNRRANIKGAVNAQWSNLPNLVKTNEKILPVSDVSESMYDSLGSIHISIALGIYFSERNEGVFKDHFITFSEKPQIHKLTGTVCDRIDQMGKLIGYNTDLEKVFVVLLNAATSQNLSQEDMPDKILLISDMEFDSCCRNRSKSNFENIEELYRRHGYKRPDMIFWNLRANNTSNFPVQIHESGTALVSGYSPNVLKNVMSGALNPEQVMLKTLNDERYNVVKI